MIKKSLRVDVTRQQFTVLRENVFCNQRLSAMERRRVVRKTLPIPGDGTRVDLYCDGVFVGAV